VSIEMRLNRNEIKQEVCRFLNTLKDYIASAINEKVKEEGGINSTIINERISTMKTRLL